MGLFDGWTRRRRIKEAAEQMWTLLKRGHNFEIPLLVDKNSLDMEAIAEVQKRHPQVQLRMYQSRGMVLGLFRGEGMRGNVGIGDNTLAQLRNSGHIGDGYENIKPEDLLAEHERFLIAQGLDMRTEERHAQQARMEREALGDVRAENHTAVTAEIPAVPGTEKDVPLAEALGVTPREPDLTPTAPVTIDGAAQ